MLYLNMALCSSLGCITAAAQAAAWTCGESVTYNELVLTARALAKATAYACSYSFVSCEVDGGWSCSYAGTSIEETARAVATAYARVWAGAYSCDDSCQAGVDEVATAVGDVLVVATTSAYVEACGGASLRSLMMMLTCCATPPLRSYLELESHLSVWGVNMHVR